MNKKRYQGLRNFIDESEYSHKDVANMIGMNPARFSQKINKTKVILLLMKLVLYVMFWILAWMIIFNHNVSK